MSQLFRIRWPKYRSFNFSISPSNEYSRLISFRMDWHSPRDSQESSQHHSLNANTTVRALVNWVGFMLKEMKMPQSMSQTGVCSEAEYRAAIPAMTEAALADHCTAGNPKEPTAEDVRGIYEKLW